MEKILVVEDDLLLSAGLCFELDSAGYMPVAAYTCAGAWRLVEQEAFSLVLLDVNLPDGNGFGLCGRIKEAIPGLPVIFLTANDMEQDMVEGFDMGAEDYVAKPFSVKVLLRRMEVALRHSAGAAKPLMDGWCDGYLELDFSALMAVRGSEKLTLTPGEYKLLKILVGNAGSVVTRQTLLEKLWDCDGNYIDDHTLTVAMNRLRTKIEDKGHSYIKTIRGMGYIWMGGKE